MEEDENEIPNFNMTTPVEKIGDKNSKVGATVFGIECAEEYAGYLKLLLSVAYKNNYIITGTFIPTAHHLITSAKSYKEDLHKQKNIQSITAIAVEGLHKDALWEDITLTDGIKLTLDYFLRKSISVIETYKYTDRADTEGRWLLMCKKENAARVIEFVDNILPDIFKEYIPQS
eukprot:13452437-Ditylum_brightwellii.AAC.1